MDIKKILSLFCSNDECRPNLCTPFNSNGYTYATNGCVAIRVPAIPEYQRDGAPSIEKVWYKDTIKDSDYEPLQLIESTVGLMTCNECHGSGSDANCSDCDGLGKVQFKSKSELLYEFSCRMCKGEGIIEGVCDECLGLGKVPREDKTEIGSKRIWSQYVYLLNQLPDCEIATEAVGATSPIPFRFNGGDGIIMPLRRLDVQ